MTLAWQSSQRWTFILKQLGKNSQGASQCESRWEPGMPVPTPGCRVHYSVGTRMSEPALPP